MTLGQLKEKIENLPVGFSLNYSLSEPFSWRGSYEEVCFSIENCSQMREELLNIIEKALTEDFEGYKGGLYRYDEYTLVNFEHSPSSYTDGDYTKKKIEELSDKGFVDMEELLIDKVIYS